MGVLSRRKFYVVNEPDLVGETICLEGLSGKHVSERYAGWFNDKEVCRYNRHGVVHNTIELTRNYVEAIDCSDEIAVFAIIARTDGEHIGNISLKISWEEESGEISIIIGEKAYWGKGVATEAYSLILDYGFNILGLKKLYSGMTARNKGMIRVVQKVGMRYEGMSKNALYKEGQFLDIVRYEIKASEGGK